MSVSLNHTIVHAHDKHASAQFLVDILGLEAPTTFGPFVVVQVHNDVSLDFADDHGAPHPQHYAFLVSETEFDEIQGRIVARGLPYWAAPSQRRAGEIHTNYGYTGIRNYRVSGRKLERTLDVSPAVSLEESVKTMVEEIHRHRYTDFDNPRYYNIQWMRLLQEAQGVIEVTGSVFDYKPAPLRKVPPPMEHHG